MGSDTTQTTAELSELVSIHAPAWGATEQRVLPLLSDIVSIHAPTWGATL